MRLSIPSTFIALLSLFCSARPGLAQQSDDIRFPGWMRHPQAADCDYSYADGDSLVLVDDMWGAFMYDGATGASRSASDSSIEGSRSITAGQVAGSGALGIFAVPPRSMRLSTNRWRTTRNLPLPDVFTTNNVYYTLHSTRRGVLAFISGQIMRSTNGTDWALVRGSLTRFAGSIGVRGSRVVSPVADTLYTSANDGESFQATACAAGTTSVQFVSVADAATTYFWGAPTVRRHVTGQPGFTALPTPPRNGQGVTGMAFIDAAHGVLGLNANYYLYTQDSGRTWSTHQEARAFRGVPYVVGTRILLRSPLGILEVDAQGNPVPRYDQVSDQSIRSMYMSPGGIGMMVQARDVYVTRDHGKGFIKMTPPTTSAIPDIGYVHNDSILLIAGAQGEVYRSADFGASWTQVRQSSFGFSEATQFESLPGGKLLLKSGGSSKISTDHGRTFILTAVNGTYNLRPDGLALVLSTGQVIRKDPANASDYPPAIGTIPSYFSVRGGVMGDTSVGYFRTQTPSALYKTTNGGRTWAEQPGYFAGPLGQTPPASVYLAHGPDSLLIYDEAIYLSTNGAASFDAIPNPGNLKFASLRLEAWAAGAGGGVLWYTRRATDRVSATRHTAATTGPAAARLWPNPAQGSARCTIGSQDALSVELYTATGACASRQTHLTEGRISLTGLAPGIYHLVAKTTTGMQGTGRIVVR